MLTLAFVSPKAIVKRCRSCKKLNVDCSCLKLSPLLNRKERSFVVVAKSWLLGWLTDEEEESSSEEESEAEQSFVFPEVDDRELFKDTTLVLDEELEEDEDLETAFIEANMEKKLSRKTRTAGASFLRLPVLSNFCARRSFFNTNGCFHNHNFVK